jgi:Cu(I)/Ag(I) efflux system membrane fusion protein
MKKSVLQTNLRYGLFVALGLFLGWILFHPGTQSAGEHDHRAEAKTAETWTCAMHPQIRMDKPGKCPICAMDLVQVNQGDHDSMDPAAIHLTREAAQLANVQTTRVSRQNPHTEIRLYGKVSADERSVQSQVAFFPGRIEKLHVNFTGEAVRKGQPLATVYSPELVTAGQELIETAKSKLSQPEIYDAAREKLRQWKLTDSQIDALEHSTTVPPTMEITSTTSGIVTARKVNNGDYVSQGTVLYEIADLSSLWVLLDAYESDLPFLKKGDRLNFTVRAMPGETLSGTILFIDPVVDPVNRVARVRVEVNNSSGKLKPEMFVTGIATSDLAEYVNTPVIPKSAVLWTGKRSVVYIRLPGDEPAFRIREVELGPAIGNSYVVKEGLSDGDEIVTEGAFSVDAAAQLEGKPSMMNPETVVAGSPGKAVPGQKELSFRVSGNCEMCKERIENAAKAVDGVFSAEWKADEGMLKVAFDGAKTGKSGIQQAIADAGHDTEGYKAKAEIYNQLPECCKYARSN